MKIAEMVCESGKICVVKGGNHIRKRGNWVRNGGNGVRNGDNERGGLRIRLMPTCIGHKQLQKII